MHAVAPCSEPYRMSFLDALEEGFRIPPEPIPSPELLFAARHDPSRFLGKLAQASEVVEAENGERVRMPPTTQKWWVSDDAFVGVIQVRHFLNNGMVAAYCGHVSCGIRPSMRSLPRGSPPSWTSTRISPGTTRTTSRAAPCSPHGCGTRTCGDRS